MDVPKLILFLHGNINNKKMRFFLLLSQRQKDRGAKEMGQTQRKFWKQTVVKMVIHNVNVLYSTELCTSEWLKS